MLKAAWKLDLVSAEDYRKAASVESVRNDTVLAGELAGLLETCEADSPGIHDNTIFSLLYGGGLRRAGVGARPL